MLMRMSLMSRMILMNVQVYKYAVHQNRERPKSYKKARCVEIWMLNCDLNLKFPVTI